MSLLSSVVWRDGGGRVRVHMWVRAWRPPTRLRPNPSRHPPSLPGCRRRRGLGNLTVLTADLVDFQPPALSAYDRVVSVECFEHMKVCVGAWVVLEMRQGRCASLPTHHPRIHPPIRRTTASSSAALLPGCAQTACALPAMAAGSAAADGAAAVVCVSRRLGGVALPLEDGLASQHTLPCSPSLSLQAILPHFRALPRAALPL